MAERDISLCQDNSLSPTEEKGPVSRDVKSDYQSALIKVSHYLIPSVPLFRCLTVSLCHCPAVLLSKSQARDREGYSKTQ